MLSNITFNITSKKLRQAMQGLYAVTPNWDDTDLLLTATEEVIRGGARMVQYRHKDIDAAMRKIQASALQQLCRDYLVPFIINDDVDLCMELNADGIHVGGTDAPIADVRQRVGAHKIVGASCYGSMDLARAAARDGRDRAPARHGDRGAELPWLHQLSGPHTADLCGGQHGG